MTKISQYFTSMGGIFLQKEEEIARKLKGIKMFLFDWDGVFNMGDKGAGYINGFTEADSMGLNLLRLGYWLGHEGELPQVGIITGLNNDSAKYLAERERLNFVYMGFKNKVEALESIMKKHELQHHEIAWVFDDVLDLSVARRTGLRFMVRRDSSPMFGEFVADSGLADYITGREGGYHAVREVTELILALYGTYFDAVKERMEYTGRYQGYRKMRNEIIPQLFKKDS